MCESIFLPTRPRRPDGDGKCTFPSVVTLDSVLNCYGKVEREADTLRVIKITDHVDATFIQFRLLEM